MSEKSGAFKRDTTYLDGRITADGRDGWPVEPDRYRLVVARGCPWANRTMIVRRLLGLEDALSMGICGPTHDWRSWNFSLDPGQQDPVLGVHELRESYEKAVPGYDRGVTVPAIVDIPSGGVVTADFRHITLDLESEWAAYHRPGAPDLYPDPLREEIEEVSALVYEDVNNGVYRCGFAQSQAAYDEAVGALFETLDMLEARLATREFLCGERVTEADWRLFVTLLRFDPVYVGLFKCNLRRIADYPQLSRYLSELRSGPAIAETIDMFHIKHHYYESLKFINPTGIVPVGPLAAD